MLVGTIAVVDIMLAEIVKKYEGNYVAYEATLGILSVSNSTLSDFVNTTAASLTTTAAYNDHLPSTPIETLTSVCLLTGLIQLAFGFFQMGAVSLILSDQLISGFSCGAAFHVIVSQLPTVFDIKGSAEGNGPLHLIWVSSKCIVIL